MPTLDRYLWRTPLAIDPPFAPAVTGTGSTNIVSLAAAIAPRGLLFLKGTADHQVYNDPTDVYNSAKAPKALITIPGATDICSANNDVGVELHNEAGTIPRLGQQLAGGAYLAALMRRFTQEDLKVQPYLNGQRLIEVDDGESQESRFSTRECKISEWQRVNLLLIWCRRELCRTAAPAAG